MDSKEDQLLKDIILEHGVQPFMLESQFENQEETRDEEAQTEAEIKEEIEAYNDVMKSIRQYALGKGGPDHENDAFNFDRVTSEISGFRNKMELEQ